jgi:Xaa-Pro aminopeptidase
MKTRGRAERGRSPAHHKGFTCARDARVPRRPDQDEIHCLRNAGAIAESAHWEVCKSLRPGVTEWEMAGVAAKALFKLGAEEMEGPSFVACSGERTGHNVPAMPTDRVIRPGDLFIIEDF